MDKNLVLEYFKRYHILSVHFSRAIDEISYLSVITPKEISYTKLKKMNIQFHKMTSCGILPGLSLRFQVAGLIQQVGEESNG